LEAAIGESMGITTTVRGRLEVLSKVAKQRKELFAHHDWLNRRQKSVASEGKRLQEVLFVLSRPKTG